MRSKVGSSENEIIINQGAIFPIINAVEFMEPGYDYGHYYKTMAEIENIKHFAMMIPAVRFNKNHGKLPCIIG